MVAALAKAQMWPWWLELPDSSAGRHLLEAFATTTSSLSRLQAAPLSLFTAGMDGVCFEEQVAMVRQRAELEHDRLSQGTDQLDLSCEVDTYCLAGCRVPPCCGRVSPCPCAEFVKLNRYRVLLDIRLCCCCMDCAGVSLCASATGYQMMLCRAGDRCPG